MADSKANKRRQPIRLKFAKFGANDATIGVMTLIAEEADPTLHSTVNSP